MLGKLTKKLQPVKFVFNFSVDYLFVETMGNNTTCVDENMYSIQWKRGRKRKGETEFLHPPVGSRQTTKVKVIFNRAFRFGGTLYKNEKKNEWQKKELLITLEEVASKDVPLAKQWNQYLQQEKQEKASKKKEEKKPNFQTTTLAKHALDLTEFVNETQETTTTKELLLAPESKKNSGVKILVKLVMNCKCLKDISPSDEDFENVSTYSGTYKEGHQEDDDEKSEDEDDIVEAERDFESTLIKNSSLYSSVSTAQTLKSNVSSENHEEPLSQHEKTNAPLALSSTSPRDVPPVVASGAASSFDALRLREIEEKFHYVRMENEQLKINLETAQEAAQQAESKLFEIQLKMQMVQSKADKEIKQVEEKIKETEKQYNNKEQEMLHQHETETERLKSELEKVKNEMTKKNNDLQNEKDKSEKNLKAEIDRLTLELKQTNERFSSNMSSSQTSFQQEIQQLKNEISELNKKKEAQQIELQKQISEISSQKSVIEAKRLELEKNLSEVTKKFLQLENDYKERQQEIHNLSQKLDKEIKEKENITSTLNNEKKLLNIEIEELRVKFSETEKKGSLQSNENSKLLETLKNERESLNTKLTTLQQDLQKTELAKSDLTFQLKKASETLQDKEDEIKKLKSELEKTKNEGSEALNLPKPKLIISQLMWKI
ncbi:hypothetical protein C9374_013581 [Naegleria lovaniensis]|uniref:C2 NT-type domain-containing protein n=1 Tax=Naegleria lovaniensis TaxID=51637 RepID=A0AA88H2Z7_NAELO|nr:uncharacterized protein C9374_013581 [Naegleria lovaniensis]KAG2392096.1 hypothetical protein C9374_013581 [Naegleria lovaniensis]